MTQRRTDSAGKGPEAEWRKQQDQEQSSDDEMARLHGESFEYKYEKNVPQCLPETISDRNRYVDAVTVNHYS